MMRAEATIYALASGRGRAGVAVVRISGPAADDVLQAMAGRLPPPRRASLVRLRDEAGNPLDEALAIRFAAGASFTGEASVELHLHGGPAVIAAVLAALSRLPGLRLAEPGEFTRRALENGRLDLTSVEALGDLIHADTEQQRRQALRNLGGALAEAVGRWRQLLLEAKAILAAAIDFADEGEVGEDAAAAARPVLAQLRDELAAALVGAERARIVADGYRVAIVGPPNAGKSSLLNRLAGSEVAIVTDLPGTTRDVLEARIDLDGYEVILQDTAGLRETSDAVERIGIERGRAAAAAADLVLALDHGPAAAWAEAEAWQDSIRVRTKLDLDMRPLGGHDVAVSVMTPGGIDSLVQRLRVALDGLDAADEPAIVSNQRQRRDLTSAIEAIESALGLDCGSEDLMAGHVDSAGRALERLIGRSGVEDVLDVVFARFCLGK